MNSWLIASVRQFQQLRFGRNEIFDETAATKHDDANLLPLRQQINNLY